MSYEAVDTQGVGRHSPLRLVFPCVLYNRTKHSRGFFICLSRIPFFRPSPKFLFFFSTGFRLKILFCVFLDFIVRHLCFRITVFGVWMALYRPAGILKPDMTHITSCRNVINIEDKASAAVLLFR